MIRTLRWLVPLFFCVLVLSAVSSQEGKKYSIKTMTLPAPTALSEPIQKLLGDSAIQLLDATGKPICDVWLRKEIPAEATPEQIKTGVTFREVKQSEIIGAIQFHSNWTDYRKQKIKAGVYTMRLAYQPTDGKHTADISDYQDFALVIAAKDDKNTALIEMKAFYDKGGDSLDLAHPGVFMLWPNPKPGKEPSLAAQPKNHWVVSSKCSLSVGGKATGTDIGIGITLVGHTPAE